METKAKIAILLATYNGEKFLGEQLDSLLKQTFQDFEIFIRDDGSQDSTVKIIQSYHDKFPCKFHIIQDKISHRGPRDGFIYLLEKVEAPYYMFCDQDDIWLNFKVEKSLEKLISLETKYPGQPAMIHTDLKIVDAVLNTKYESMCRWGRYNVNLNKHFNFAALGNVFTGCTMIFNKALRDKVIPVNPVFELHDEWVGIMATKVGHVDNIPYPTILYRQHGKNVVSAGEKNNFNINKISSFVYSEWYKNRKPILDSLYYGNAAKIALFKFLYTVIRMVKHN